MIRRYIVSWYKFSGTGQHASFVDQIDDEIEAYTAADAVTQMELRLKLRDGSDRVVAVKPAPVKEYR